ncbi:MAG TPA: MarR family transcriptional regulator [Quisquiliibacterium sp.]|nr:MarR family transcriptional regulator [Quisquiliibacterium sp.]
MMQITRQSSQIMHQSLSTLLLPEYRRRILGLLLLRPEEALHGREIARRTGLPAGSVARELQRLAAAGLLERERRGNQQVYRANTGSPIFAELASILRKTSGMVDVLADALAPLAPRLRVAFVFGSVAQGRETAGSDVDVMLVGDLSFREAVELLHPAQAAIGREVNPKVFATEEFRAKLRAEPFLAEVMTRPKLFVIGNAHDLEELARDQS